MYIEKQKNIKVILGSFPVRSNISVVFDEVILNFFNDISKMIISEKKCLKYPDLVQFGFWCRKPNLVKIANNYAGENLVVGRGTVLHIVPSNVPMNFAYSFAYGMLSGNTNIVRLPNKNFIQTKKLCEIIEKLCKKKIYRHLINKICFIKFEKSEKLASYFSNHVDCRLIWGGDETARVFKSYVTKLKCIDLIFPNRYSTSIINLDSLKKLNKIKLYQLVKRFYTDCYTMDQQGCSSPQSIIWVGKNNEKIKKNFWSCLNKIVEKEYNHDLSVTNKKLSSIFKLAVKNNGNFFYNLKNFKVAKIELRKNKKNLEKIQCHYGTFTEINLKKINKLKDIISEKIQTVTYYGFIRKDLENLILKYNFNGLDRLVPIGRAFDMGEIWDGYDVIRSLSRTIGN
tara:strand:+ start:738 stop:1931 length:1194 start_codon:yes stop_codon:yes gene_type:complete